MVLTVEAVDSVAVDPVAAVVLEGLSATPKALPPWLFYDEAGSALFERITTLPEYYLTRTERGILTDHIEEILHGVGAQVSVVELGAGTASKTGIVLRAAAEAQGDVLYQPIDVSPSALEEAERSIAETIPGVTVRSQAANYILEPIRIDREPGRRILALYIGSSIGNFSPTEAQGILVNLRDRMQPGDCLLLGTDLAPSKTKSVESLLAAYDDAQGVTAAFNRNMLTRLNRDLGADFVLECFAHRARWNAPESRIEMHLEALSPQTVTLPANPEGAAHAVTFAAGETIHTENSYKFTRSSLKDLLEPAGFGVERTFEDGQGLFAVTLVRAV